MSKKQKIMINEKIKGKLYPETLDVSYENVTTILKKLNNIIATYSKFYESITIDPQHDCGCRYNCNCTPTFYFLGTRLETDEEFLKRTDKAAHEKFLREKKEREEFERLKKKYGES